METTIREHGRRWSPLAVAVLGATAAIGVVMAYKTLPQLRRYIRMKRM